MDIWAKVAWGLVGAWAALIGASFDTASNASKEAFYSLNGLAILVTAVFIGAWFFTQVEK